MSSKDIIDGIVFNFLIPIITSVDQFKPFIVTPAPLMPVSTGLHYDPFLKMIYEKFESSGKKLFLSKREPVGKNKVSVLSSCLHIML